MQYFFSNLRNKKNPALYFSNLTQFDLKGINGT